MRFINEFLFLIFLSTSIVAQNKDGPTTNTSAIPVKGYQLFWSDEFDGNTLDFNKWDYRGLGPRRSAVNVKESVLLDGRGHLALRTEKQSDEYHTAMIGTQGKFETTFGYFEVKAKLQTQIGHWSAFWLQSPTMGQKIGNPNEAGAEIDIFEYLRKEGDEVRHAIHWDGYLKDHKKDTSKVFISGLSQGWHTFGLLWTKEKYAFYIDGNETWSTKQGVSHRDQYIILSLEVGNWAGDASKANFPDFYYIDYVRVYKEKINQAELNKSNGK